MKPCFTPASLAAAFAALALVSAASAQTIILQSDFNAYSTAGNADPGAPWNQVFDSDNGSAEIDVVADASNWFGSGTGNQILRLLDTTNTAGLRLAAHSLASTANVVTLTFRFYEPSGVNGTPLNVRLGGGSNDGDADVAFNIGFDSGNTNSGSYSLNTVNTVTIVANNSTSMVNYHFAGGPQTVNSLSYDLYINGVLRRDNFGKGGTFADGSALTALRFTTFSGGFSQDFYIDDVLLVSGAPIPEPSSAAALLGLAAGGFAATRRRRYA
jgi:hypothetical protein